MLQTQKLMTKAGALLLAGTMLVTVAPVFANSNYEASAVTKPSITKMSKGTCYDKGPSIKVSWKSGDSSYNRYRVFYRTNKGAWKKTKLTEKHSVKVMGKYNSKLYAKVAAYNGENKKITSSTKKKTILPLLPTKYYHMSQTIKVGQKRPLKFSYNFSHNKCYITSVLSIYSKNTKIADVDYDDNNKLMLEGKKPGKTTLIAMPGDGTTKRIKITVKR